MNETDYSWFINQVVLPMWGIIGTALIAYVGKRISDWIGLKQDEAARKVLNDALTNAANFAVQKATKGQQTAAVVAQEAANYVSERVPDAMNRLKITKGQIPDMVAARVPAAEVAAVVPETIAPVINVPQPAPGGG